MLCVFCLQKNPKQNTFVVFALKIQFWYSCKEKILMVLSPRHCARNTDIRKQGQISILVAVHFLTIGWYQIRLTGPLKAGFNVVQFLAAPLSMFTCRA